jgi:hypothetical protein
MLANDATLKNWKKKKNLDKSAQNVNMICYQDYI